MQIINFLRSILFIALLLSFCLTGFAKTSARGIYNPKTQRIIKEDGKNVIYNKRNVVDFDGSLIEGAIKNPSEFYFVHRPEEKFGSLVKKRKNFHKEMLRDTVMIR